MDNISKMFEIAERAKGLGDYSLPNAVFCLLIEARAQKMEGVGGLKVILEVAGDHDGRDPEQAYYDLFAVRLGALRLSIPLPCLKLGTIAALFKSGCEMVNKVDRPPRIPRRNTCEKILDLWVELEDLLERPKYSILGAVNRHLTNVALEDGRFAVADRPEWEFPTETVENPYVVFKE